MTTLPLDLAALALEAAVGVAIVCDANLAIVVATPGCRALLGYEIRIGESVVKALCGEGPERPIAEALARGIAVKGSIVRLHPVIATGPTNANRRRGSPTTTTTTITIDVSAVPLRETTDTVRAVALLEKTNHDKAPRGAHGWLLRLAAVSPVTGHAADDDEMGDNDDDIADADTRGVPHANILDDRDVRIFHGIHTREPVMHRVFHIVERAAKRDISVLVRGPSGAGKELIAAAIHQLSPRRQGPFRAINCAALPPDLLESELFGHVKGAFTGAVKDHPGIFRAASGGTLFLDEVAEMPLGLQAKLLRVLETQTVLPVGSTTAIAVDVRIVSATHQSLRQAVRQGTFRADLMYRLRVVPIFLPALRDRRRDIALLTQVFIQQLNHGGLRNGTRVVDRLSRDALRRLNAYAWPGNVRELHNALEYAYVIGEGATLQETDLPPELFEDPNDESDLDGNANDGPTLARSSARPSTAATPATPASSPEATQIQRALQRTAGSRERAAAMLGISRITLWRRMTALGITPAPTGGRNSTR